MLKVDLSEIAMIGMGSQSATLQVYFASMILPKICFLTIMLAMLVFSSRVNHFERNIDIDQILTTQNLVKASDVVKSNERSKVSSADLGTSMLARPLFEPGRRPSTPAQVQEPVPVMPRLAGIMITPERSVAIFQQGSSPRSLVVKTGEVLEGIWNIASIAAGGVSLTHDDTVLVLMPHSAANRDLPNLEPTRSWKVGLRRSDPLPSYLKRLK